MADESIYSEMRDLDFNEHRQKWRRENRDRIFVNRNVFLDKIQFFGFDMDYTIAEYISPAYEQLIYKYAIKLLVEMGYPQEIILTEYDPKFATRGIIFDKLYGNFLKIDPNGNIMTAVHGFSFIDTNTARDLYRNRFIDISDVERFSIFNTLYEFPSMFTMANVIDCLEKNTDWQINDRKFCLEKGSIQITYKTIHDDVIEVIHSVHNTGGMKQETIDNITKYIKKDKRIPILFRRIKDSGRKTFLVTNSGYDYTDKVLSYLFNTDSNSSNSYSNWRDYFDLIVVDAKKPLFFGKGTSISQIDVKTGKKHIGCFTGEIKHGTVFAGGNSEILSQMLGANGKDILYVGDHIFGDILKSKKRQGWRTYLVVPELKYEIYMWIHLKEQYDTIAKHEVSLSNIYKNMDSGITERPENINEHVEKIRDLVVKIEKSYGFLGSLLRCGYRQTFFSGQLARFADLYSHTCLNLINYPFFYLFRGPENLLPHEATIDMNESISSFKINRTPSLTSLNQQKFSKSRNMTLCLEEPELEEMNQNLESTETSIS